MSTDEMSMDFPIAKTIDDEVGGLKRQCQGQVDKGWVDKLHRYHAHVDAWIEETVSRTSRQRIVNEHR